MPFTPLHMGPGILVKALLQTGFSLTVFGWTQIVMDIQPLIVMLSGEGRLHGFTHTYAGATLIALFAAATGKYLAEIGLNIIGVPQGEAIPISWPVTFLSAFIGSYSHVLLDSFMHADVEPFFPVALDNLLLHLLSVENLHRLCIYSGILGGALYFWLQRRRAAKPLNPGDRL